MSWQTLKVYVLPWLILALAAWIFYLLLNDIILGLWYLSEPISKVLK